MKAMKTTVSKDEPGTVLNRRARLHRALDAVLDKRVARDATQMPSVKCKDCGQTVRLYKSGNDFALTSHNDKNGEECPGTNTFVRRGQAKDSEPVGQLKGENYDTFLARMAKKYPERYNTKKGAEAVALAKAVAAFNKKSGSAKDAKDEYKYAEPPKKPKPIVTFLDRYRQQEEARKATAK